MKKLFFTRTSLIILALFALGITPACKAIKDFNMYSTSEDIKLGSQVVADIKKNPKEYPILNNPQAKEYLTNMMNQILSSPSIKYRTTFKYSIEIINDDKTINAFAAPGGYIYVYTGLLKMLDNEATLAAVIGHEIGHVENRHATKRMTKSTGVQALTEIALGNDRSKGVDMATNLFTGLGFLANSREDEYQADEASYNYLSSTKWYPGAIKIFFEKVKGSNASSGLETLLSTHPMPKERIDAVNDRIKKSALPPPTEYTLFGVEYSKFKKLLK